MGKNIDPEGRKWQITINNPIEKGFDHERIKIELDTIKPAIYWCLADEIGKEGTPHTCIFLACSSAVRFSRLKRLFPCAHLERAVGTAQENRDYILKEGKWKDTEKAETSVPGTFEEWGNMPIERQGGGSVEAIILQLILNGATNADILLQFPDYLRGIRDVDYVRQNLREEEYRYKNRDVQVTYVSGPTGVGKSYNLMNDEDLISEGIYRITDYAHPWDMYAGQRTVIMEEFHSSLPIGEMLNICDVYPLFLRARYTNKIAMFDKLFIVSNLNLQEQYPNVQAEKKRVWGAFLRRIQKVIVYTAYQVFQEYSREDYLLGNGGALTELPADTPTPFDANEFKHDKFQEV